MAGRYPEALRGGTRIPVNYSHLSSELLLRPLARCHLACNVLQSIRHAGKHKIHIPSREEYGLVVRHRPLNKRFNIFAVAPVSLRQLQAGGSH
jgi:hypothetical protein